MRQRVGFVAVTLLVVLTGATAYFSSRSAGSTASAATATTTTVPRATGFYLDMGASASLGFQPTGILHHNGHRTDTGYANDLLSLERFRGVSLTLDQVGCPGDVVQTVLNTTENDHCYTAPNTQLTKSVAYLKANATEIGVVTIDLGFNNLRLCLTPDVVNEPCVAAGVAAVRVDMPKILAQLKAAAGPHVHFVGVLYSDPFLAHYFNGADGPAEATASLDAMNELNATLLAAYTAAGVASANVPGISQVDNTTLVTVPNVGTIPENVEETCSLTWMCYSAPFGPDDHPNDAGYALIAQAILAALPKL
jgi:lysophospholipase L1-like esterase